MAQPLLKLQVIQGPPLAPNQVFEIHENEMLYIQGESGAGKSSLLRAFALIPKNLQAEVELNGKNVPPSEMPKYRREIQLVPQSPTFPPLTIEETLREPFSYESNSDLTFDEEKTKEMLKELALGHLALHRPIRELSGGEKTRLALLRSLLLEPKILLLDEPFAHLDQIAAKQVAKYLQTWIRKAQTTLAIVSHQMSLLTDEAPKIREIHLQNGALK